MKWNGFLLDKIIDGPKSGHLKNFSMKPLQSVVAKLTESLFASLTYDEQMCLIISEEQEASSKDVSMKSDHSFFFFFL